MSLDFAKLVVQGRAKSLGVCWTAEEWEALLLIEKECKLERTVAADFIRNGVTTSEGVKKAQEVKFVPKTREEAEEEVEKTLKAEGEKVVGKPATAKEPKSKKK